MRQAQRLTSSPLRVWCRRTCATMAPRLDALQAVGEVGLQIALVAGGRHAVDSWCCFPSRTVVRLPSPFHVDAMFRRYEFPLSLRPRLFRDPCSLRGRVYSARCRLHRFPRLMLLIRCPASLGPLKSAQTRRRPQSYEGATTPCTASLRLVAFASRYHTPPARSCPPKRSLRPVGRGLAVCRVSHYGIYTRGKQKAF